MSPAPCSASVTGPDIDLGGRGGGIALTKRVFGFGVGDTRLLLLEFVFCCIGGKRLSGGGKSFIGALS